MNGKYVTVLALVLALLLATSVTAFAQSNGPMVGDQAQGTAPQDGTGLRRGWSGSDQGFVRDGINFLDEDGDGACDNFVDEDGDGLCDNCDQDGGQQMARRNARSQDDASAAGSMRRGNGGRGGRR